MKVIFFCLFFFSYSLVGQNLINIFDIGEYKKEADKKLKEEFDNKKSSPKGILNEYNLLKITTVSIPILKINMDGKGYKCELESEKNIDLKQNPRFQLIGLVLDGKATKEGLLLIDELEKNEANNTLLNSDQIVFVESGKELKRVTKYINSNPKTLIFIIKYLNGYWAIKKDRIYKIRFGIFKRLKFINSRKEFCKYGVELINDLYSNGLKVGYPYETCNCKL